jgi:hypothetical protein
MTTTKTIDHVTLEHLVVAGVVRSANVVGQSGGWEIIIKYGMVEQALAARRGAIRIFRKFETLVTYLKSLGISEFNVNADNYTPVALTSTRVRPDASARMKRAFDAVEYDKWFREQVEEGVKQADNPETIWLSNDNVVETAAKRRAEWQKKAEAASV